MLIHPGEIKVLKIPHFNLGFVDPLRYVLDKLQLYPLTQNNMLSLARALSLNPGELDDLVETTGGDEEKQLQKITKIWTSKAENNELPRFIDFISSTREGKLVHLT